MTSVPVRISQKAFSEVKEFAAHFGINLADAASLLIVIGRGEFPDDL